MACFIWLGLLVVFLIVEAACPFHLVSIWFSVGALAAAIVALLHGAVWLQMVVFFVVSGALLALLWPLVKKVFQPRLSPTNVDSLIGAEGYVIADVDNRNAVGQVKLNGMEWSARSVSGELIPAGTAIVVDHIEGVKVFVSVLETQVKV